MAISYAVRKQLLAASLPEANEVRLQLQDYLARTGMAPPDFARRINYARETLCFFLNGRYSKISYGSYWINRRTADCCSPAPTSWRQSSPGKPWSWSNGVPGFMQARLCLASLRRKQPRSCTLS